MLRLGAPRASRQLRCPEVSLAQRYVERTGLSDHPTSLSGSRYYRDGDLTHATDRSLSVSPISAPGLRSTCPLRMRPRGMVVSSLDQARARRGPAAPARKEVMRSRPPEPAPEPESPEDLLRLLRGPALEARREPVAVPCLRQLPRLLQRQGLAPGPAPLLAPRADRLLRPEEQDVRSGED